MLQQGGLEQALVPECFLGEAPWTDYSVYQDQRGALRILRIRMWGFQPQTSGEAMQALMSIDHDHR